MIHVEGLKRQLAVNLEREQIDPLFIEQRVPRYMFRLMGARRSACRLKAPMKLSLGLFLFLQNSCFTLLLIQVDLAILTKIYPGPRYWKINFFSITLASEHLWYSIVIWWGEIKPQIHVWIKQSTKILEPKSTQPLTFFFICRIQDWFLRSTCLMACCIPLLKNLMENNGFLSDLVILATNYHFLLSWRRKK